MLVQEWPSAGILQRDDSQLADYCAWVGERCGTWQSVNAGKDERSRRVSAIRHYRAGAFSRSLHVYRVKVDLPVSCHRPPSAKSR